MKVKLKSLVPGVMTIKPNAGLKLESIALVEGKVLEFESVETYSQYKDSASRLIQSKMLEVVQEEAKKEEKLSDQNDAPSEELESEESEGSDSEEKKEKKRGRRKLK
jgi:hypothetical protein